VITGDDLRAAAASIDQAPDAETRRRLAQFKETCRARSDREALRDQMDMDSCVDALDKDLADYQSAEAALASGDLITAAEWFRKAAENDFSDAALRLAMVYEEIAGKHLARPGRATPGPDELHFVVEASTWYVAAYAAGDIESDEAGERVEQLLTRHDPAGISARPRLELVPAGADANDGTAGQPGPRSPSPTHAGSDMPEPRSTTGPALIPETHPGR
jgi:hypothetical protein